MRLQADWISPCLAAGTFIHCAFDKISVSGVSFVGTSLQKCTLENSQFVECIFEGLDLHDCHFAGSEFTRTNLKSSNLPDTLIAVAFKQADLTGASLPKKLRDLNMEGVVLERVDLSSVDLSKTNLSGARLSTAQVSGADFSGAILDRAVLRDLDLSDCQLGDATLREAHLERAVLPKSMKKAVFTGAILTDAVLPEDLSDLDLTGATLTNVRLDRRNLRGANLSHADLSGAQLAEADLTGAILTNANLTGADLRKAKKIVLDSTQIRNTHFSPHTDNRWLALRRDYTGTRFITHLMLLLLFVLPYAIEAATWVNVGRIEARIQAEAEKLQAAAMELRSNGQTRIADLLDSLASSVPCPEGECDTRRVWELLLGLHRIGVADHTVAVSIGFVLILYNVCRGILTFRVGPLREEEERSGYSPALKGLDGYAWLWVPHLIVKTLTYIAIAYFLFHLWTWLRTPVLMPRS
jgi:uncharacterized protein YjbI with pentapeptide repeats